MSLDPELLHALEPLQLTSSPVALAFLDAPPASLPRVDQPQPAGCGYWKNASEGQAFYTTAEDHVNCPIGAFTHGVTLSPDQGRELETMLGTMVELKYIKAAEIPAFPHRGQPLRVAAYAPLAGAPFDPDVVIFRGNARQIMLLSEAARAAGVLEAGRVMGRPACAIVPQTIQAAGAVASIGCIGNRVYTGLGDDELYLSVPGSRVREVLDHLEPTLQANQALEEFHLARARQARA